MPNFYQLCAEYTAEDEDYIVDLAKRRKQKINERGTDSRTSLHKEIIGITAEYVFPKVYPVTTRFNAENFDVKGKGDGGKDYIGAFGYKIDVKGTEFPRYEYIWRNKREGKIKCNALVLGRVLQSERKVYYDGWAVPADFLDEERAGPLDDAHARRIHKLMQDNYVIHFSKLRPMQELPGIGAY